MRDLSVVKDYMTYVANTLMSREMYFFDSKRKKTMWASILCHVVRLFIAILFGAFFASTQILDHGFQSINIFYDIVLASFSAPWFILIYFLSLLFKVSLCQLLADGPKIAAYIIFPVILLVYATFGYSLGVLGLIMELSLITITVLEHYADVCVAKYTFIYAKLKTMIKALHISDQDARNFLDGHAYDNGFVNFGIQINDTKSYSEDRLIEDLKAYMAQRK